MASPDYPYADRLRNRVLRRAQAFARESGMPLSMIGKRAINDPALVHSLANGRNLTLRTYERVMRWLDTHQSKFYERQKRKSNGKRR